jgi:3',5'-cyclic AMP phosphodiesterase CpdA
MSNEILTRREWLKLSATVGAGMALAGAPTTSFGNAEPEEPRGRSLRIAHLTDSHTQPERRAAEGTIACLRHVQTLKPSVDLIVTGGDLIFDSFEADRARTKLQWDLFSKILRDECGVPVEHTLGNHDIWGWDQKKSGANGNEPDYGKKWALDALGLEKPYRSFDRGAWHFVILDSVVSDGDGYLGRLDDEQFDWLRRDLSGVTATTPIVVISHIPILAACVLNDSKSKADKARQFTVPGHWMMIDSRRVRELFRAHRNVRLCLSGHIHQLDRVDFDGVTYICDGAVSGAWWKGPEDNCPEGYGVIDMHPNGTWSHEYKTYGWKADSA